jgi:hypothetical protein
MSKTPVKPITPNREAAINAARTRDYLMGYEVMTKRYEDGWYKLGDKIGTPSIDDRNPYDSQKQPDQFSGFEDAKKRLFHL